MPDRPNILFLMSDEHRPDVVGYEGDDVVRTPVLDSLAETGTVFRHAYTPSPVCIPGRQAMMAGQLPRTCGVERFREDLTPGYMTFARRLAQYGYRTVAAGKLHHTGEDQMQGWTHRIGMEMGVLPKHIVGRDVASYEGLSEPFAHKWSMDMEVRRAGVGRPPYHVHDDLAVDGALQYVHEHFVESEYDRAIPEVPLLLKVSLNQPHYPFLSPTKELFDYYLARVRPFSDQELFDHPGLNSRHVVRPGVEVSEREHRRAVAAYYAMVENCDRLFGKVLDSLGHAGQDLDDWIIIYTSDHGELIGEHGVYEKGSFFEGSVRVPLIIRYPRRFAPGVVDRNVNLCDLFATLCELTGSPTPDGLDSRSLTGLLSGVEDDWDDESVSQFNGRNLMIKRGALKYLSYAEDGEVLFDHDVDSTESKNLVMEAEYHQDLSRFRERAKELGFGVDG